jgi:hypothetical protein
VSDAGLLNEVSRLRGDAEIARLRLQAAHAEVERLRLTDAERDVLATVRDIYASHDDDDSCSRIAAVIDGLLTRAGGTNE